MHSLLVLGVALLLACGPDAKPASPQLDQGPRPCGIPSSQGNPWPCGAPQEAEVEETTAGHDKTPEEATPPTGAVEKGTLDRLAVTESVLVGYSRKDWKHWTDDDHDCQDARQEVLIEESEIPVTFKTERNCKVLTGRWTCPYTGEVFTDPKRLDVDHMVPLGAAYSAGGHAWDPERRRAFANELGVAHHLIAVMTSANRSKGKKGPEEWLPANAAYVCEYVRTWIDIKVQWNLTITAVEKGALEAQLSRCHGTVQPGLESP